MQWEELYMDKSNAIVEQASKISTYAIYDLQYMIHLQKFPN